MSLEITLLRLQQAEGFYVKQNWKAVEHSSECCHELANSYEVYNIKDKEEVDKNGREDEKQIFSAVEKTGFWALCCCGKNRAFDFNFEAPEGQEAFVRLHRMYRGCGWAVLPCCAHKVNVNSGVQIGADNVEVVGSLDNLNSSGYVQAPPFHGGCFTPKFNIYDKQKNKVGYIENLSSCPALPCIVCDFCGADFIIHKEDKDVGVLKKLGVKTCISFICESHAELDTFTVQFHQEAIKSGSVDTNFKLAVLAALVQIDFNFYEDSRGCLEGKCCNIACCGYTCACLPCSCFYFLCDFSGSGS